MKIKDILTYSALILTAVYLIHSPKHIKKYQNYKNQLEDCQEMKDYCFEHNNSSVDEFTRCMRSSCDKEETQKLEDLADQEFYSALIPGYSLLHDGN